MSIEPRLTPNEKQQIWRMKQIQIFYGSGRPIFKITKDNQYERKNYECKYYTDPYILTNLHNKNFVAYSNVVLEKYAATNKDEIKPSSSLLLQDDTDSHEF